MNNTLLRPEMIEAWARAVYRGRWRVEFLQRRDGLAMRIRVARKQRTVAVPAIDLALPIVEYTSRYLRPIATELQLASRSLQ
jgi:hypothetical protein